MKYSPGSSKRRTAKRERRSVITVLPSLFVKTLHDSVRGITAWIAGIIALISVQLGVYPTVRASASRWVELAEVFPEYVREIFRMDDYGTAVGYLSTELFSATLPLMFVTLGVTWGARIATDEVENGTADVLFALPISRRSFIVTRISAMVAVLFACGTALALGLVVGTRIVDMDVAASRIVSGSVTMVLIGLFFGALAAFIGSATGRRSMGLGVGLAFAIACFVVYSLAPLVDVMDALNPYNPMQWTLGADALRSGFAVRDSIWAVLGAAAFLGLALLAFDRRDVPT